MQIVNVYPRRRRGSLNIRSMLNLIFYDGAFPMAKCHPDSTRQRGARRKALDRHAARKLKRQYVPLYRVDPTVYLEERDYMDRPIWQVGTALGRTVDGERWYSPSDMGKMFRLGIRRAS